jgi:hypothetical protein
MTRSVAGAGCNVKARWSWSDVVDHGFSSEENPGALTRTKPLAALTE